MSKGLIGVLDIGSSKITAVIATIEQGLPPKVIGLATVQARGIKKGMVVNIDEAVNSVAQVLNAAERMADVNITNVVIAFSGKAILSRNNTGVIAVNHTHEEITSDDVLRVIEAAQTIQMPQGYELLHTIPNEYIIDSQDGIKYPIGMSGSRLEVDCHIVLVASSVLKNIGKCVQKLAIGVDKVIFAGWADTYSVLTDTEKDLGVVLMDIGAGTTDIVIFQDDKVIFTGSIPVGGANITNDVAVGLHLSSLDDAEKVKLNYKEILNRADNNTKQDRVETPSFSKNKNDRNTKEEKKNEEKFVDVSFLNIEGLKEISVDFLKKIITMRVEDILEMAKNEVARAGCELVMPAGVVLVGGTAKLFGITNMVKNSLQVPARVGIPHGLDGMTEEISGPEYVTVQGAVLYATNRTDFESLSTEKDSGGIKNLIDRIKMFFKSLIP